MVGIIKFIGVCMKNKKSCEFNASIQEFDKLRFNWDEK
jgi:hypothetical protein